MTDAEITARLIDMGRADQAERQKPYAEIDFNKDLPHARALREIIGQVGWPAVSRFGEEAAKYAFLIAQHAVFDLDGDSAKKSDSTFQKRWRNLLRPLWRRGEVRGQYYAMLVDRILVNDGLPQLFGSQFERDPNGGGGRQCRIWRPEHVTARCHALGFVPWDPVPSNNLGKVKAPKLF